MKTKQKFEPTHRITYRDGKGELVYEVMLVDGAGYTQSEWDSESAADFEMDEEGDWTLAGHAFNGSVETLPKRVPCCSKCGGVNVESTAWIEYREDGSERPTTGEGPFGNEEGNWCHDCQEHLDIIYPSYTRKQSEKRQHNNACREHGPELFKALEKLMEQADLGEVPDELRPVVKRAKQLITQITTGKEG